MANHLHINRPGTTIARYKMLQHSHRLPNRFISPLMRTARVRFFQDGLTTCRFRLLDASARPLYTHFLIDIGQPSSVSPLPKNHTYANSTSRVKVTEGSSHHQKNKNTLLLDLPRDGSGDAQETTQSNLKRNP
jgi:hypothetical protein